MDLSGVELGPKMQACSERERKFAYALGTGAARNATEAARLAGYVDSGDAGIRVRAHALMHRERVISAIEEVCRREFRSLVPATIMATKAILEKPDHPDHLKMVTSMLSRLGFGEKTGLDVNVSGEVRLNHTDEALEDLRRLLALRVPRDKLIETFGQSGLERYERMMAAADAKLIEGKAEHVE